MEEAAFLRAWMRAVGCGAQEAGRLFCGKCGNAALQKVEVVVGPQGLEQYGVRKKHVLRGTRFSLPKPKVVSGLTADMV